MEFRPSHYSPNKCVVRRRCFPNKRNRVSPIGSACHPGEIAPQPHPEITNEKHRLRCPNNWNHFPAKGSACDPKGFWPSHYSQEARRTSTVFSKKAKSRHCHRVRFPAIWTCDATTAPKLSTYSINGVSKNKRNHFHAKGSVSRPMGVSRPMVSFPCKWELHPSYGLRWKRSLANWNERPTPICPHFGNVSAWRQPFPVTVHIKIEK